MGEGGLAAALAGLCVGACVWLVSDARLVAHAGAWAGRLRLRGSLHGGVGAQVQPQALSGALELLLRRLVPAYRARGARAEERARCLDELSELIDVVALGISAGVSFDAALQIYCARYKTVLAGLLQDAMHSWQLGMSTRREALGALARRLEVPAFTMFVDTVLESLEFGAPLAGALVGQAQAVRAARRSAVQEQIEKAPVKMLVPTGTLVLPAMLLAILGPLLASLADMGF